MVLEWLRESKYEERDDDESNEGLEGSEQHPERDVHDIQQVEQTPTPDGGRNGFVATNSRTATYFHQFGVRILIANIASPEEFKTLGE